MPHFTRFFFAVCALTLAFAACIFAARMIGSTQPPSPALAQLHLTDCTLPCWLGITPGQTTLVDAVRRVTAAYPKTVPSIIDGRLVNADTTFGQIILMADRAGIVHRISLPTFRLKGVALADAVSLLGKPTWVVGIHPTAVYYGCTSFLAVISGSSVDGGWQQRLVIIDIQDVGYSCPAGKQ